MATLRFESRPGPVRMRWSRTFIPTIKQRGKAAEIPSHVLMLRSGMVRRVMAGAYAYLPLGLRALRKAAEILRRELEAAGAIELALGSLAPLALWERTGRADQFGDELIRLSLGRGDRRARLALAPAHEEVVTELVAQHVTSFRQLPLVLYQVQAKFRNEARPRLGVLRTSEFLTHDAYSFDTSADASADTYQRMQAAYCRVFTRCGLECLTVEAETGPTGALVGHEFVVPAENGEDRVAQCSACGYAASFQWAQVGPPGGPPSEVPPEPVRKVDTPGATTIDQVSTMLGCRPPEMIKTLLYTVDGAPVAVLIRGDHEANENKIRRALSAATVEMAGPDVVQKVTGAPVGFAGPVGMKERTPIWADRAIQLLRNAVTGANQADAHLTGVNPDRDFQFDGLADLRNVVDGDPCPRCGSRLAVKDAIEVGHLLQVGTRYSEALGAQFVDDRQRHQPIFMGSYRIGLNRLLAALVETSHDARGIIWPVALAPHEVLLVPLDVREGATLAVAGRLDDELTSAGVDVLLDDRDQRAGVKFYDADLVGIPLRVVIGPRGLQTGRLEVKWRWETESATVDLDGAAGRIAELVRREREDGTRFTRHRRALSGPSG